MNSLSRRSWFLGSDILISIYAVLQLTGGFKNEIYWRETVGCFGHSDDISDPVRSEEFLH